MTATAAVATRDTLTAREVKMIVGMSEGLTDPEMARMLGITKHAMSQATSRLIRRFGARSRTQLVTFALRRGLIPGGFRPVRTPRDIGPTIAGMRRRAKMTPHELAFRVRVDVRHILEIEAGGIMPRLEVFLAITAVLGAPMYVEAS